MQAGETKGEIVCWCSKTGTVYSGENGQARGAIGPELAARRVIPALTNPVPDRSFHVSIAGHLSNGLPLGLPRRLELLCQAAIHGGA